MHRTAWLLPLAFVSATSARPAGAAEGRPVNDAEGMRIRPQWVLDLSSPLNAYRSYLDALRWCDADAMKQCLSCRDATERVYADHIVRTDLARRKLCRMAESKFGPEARQSLKGNIGYGYFDEDINTVRNKQGLKPEFDVDGKSATLHCRRLAAYAWFPNMVGMYDERFLFDKADGSWRISVPLLFWSWSGDKVEMNNEQTAVLQRLTAELQTGRIISTQQLAKMIHTHFTEIMAKHQPQAPVQLEIGK
jgi:hypothetical protein